MVELTAPRGDAEPTPSTSTTATIGGSEASRSAPPQPAPDPLGPTAQVEPAAAAADAVVGLPDATARYGQLLTFHLLPECHDPASADAYGTGADADGTVSDGTVSDGTVSDDTVSDDTVSDDTVSDDTVSDDTVSDGTVVALADVDNDPDTFTVDTHQLDVGPHTVHLVCQGQVAAQARVVVYRQNGAARGEASSIALAGGVGLASMTVLVGRPAPPGVRRRAKRWPQ
jgi:hypothetical protein